jgi:hypothetical protein
LKKFAITNEQFESYMQKEPVEHSFYGTQWDKKYFRKYYIFKKLVGPLLDVVAKFKS